MSQPINCSPTTLQRTLVAYFRSGWAFLIPYLALYLFYAWLGGPIHPTGDSPGSQVGFRELLPPLLHAYWFIHGLHLAAGLKTLWSCWRDARATPSPDTPQSADHRSLDSICRLFPWLCLALCFWIPGVYLEFPSDPWHHYARVNEWSWLQSVTEHSEWKKSCYLLAYSLVGQVTPAAHQLAWFGVFYTGCCLLLCWQYFRLARATGLGERAAFVFVLIQALVLGNNVFGFYRYYGMSSSVFAQLGAIALTRFVLEIGGPRENESALDWGRRSSAFVSWRALGVAGTVLALAVLIAFNHVQGVGIAALGGASVLCWRLVRWRRASFGWLIGAVLLASAAATRWLPRDPLLDRTYRPEGWLTSWYGFNFFDPGSPTFQRAIAIIGAFGVVNLLAGLALIRRNQVAAWLTLFPLLALCLPVVSIPFANALAAKADFLDSGYILAFSRMLFAIPAGLALVTLATQWWPTASPGEPGSNPAAPGQGPGLVREAAFPLLLAGLVALVAVPPTGRYFNRLYNILMIPPADLAMKHVIDSAESRGLLDLPKRAASGETQALNRLAYGDTLATPGIGYVLNATGNTLIRGARKWMTWPSLTPPSLNNSVALEQLQGADTTLIRRAHYQPLPALFSVGSITGSLSRHWLPNEVALEHAGQAELFAPPPSLGRAPRAPQIWLEWWVTGREDHRFMGRPPETEGQALPVEDRGPIEATGAPFVVRPQTALTLRPVMNTPDGNGWQLHLRISHPPSTWEQIFTGTPSRLRGNSWLYGDYQLQITEPGRYDIEILGTTLLPKSEFVVRYHLLVPP